MLWMHAVFPSRASSLLSLTALLACSSVEKQNYVNALKREKEAFERLIEHKGRMVCPLVTIAGGNGAPRSPCGR